MSEAAVEEARAPATETFDAKLVAARTMSPSVRELVFERVGGAAVRFEPGQWFNLLVPKGDGTDAKRAYSIASAPADTARFEIAVTRVDGGEASKLLHDLSVGESVRAIGPSGFFTRVSAEPTSALFIGTGTGVTPLRSMILAAIGRAPPPIAIYANADTRATSSDIAERRRLWLLLGVRREDEILYRDELEALAAAHSAFRFHVSLSQPSADWRGLTGYVQTHVGELWKQLGDPNAHAYICGLERMVKSVKDVLRGDLGVGRKQVHQERYD